MPVSRIAVAAGTVSTTPVTRVRRRCATPCFGCSVLPDLPGCCAAPAALTWPRYGLPRAGRGRRTLTGGDSRRPNAERCARRSPVAGGPGHGLALQPRADPIGTSHAAGRGSRRRGGVDKRAAVAALSSMATFTEAGVSTGPSRPRPTALRQSHRDAGNSCIRNGDTRTPGSATPRWAVVR